MIYVDHINISNNNDNNITNITNHNNRKNKNDVLKHINYLHHHDAKNDVVNDGGKKVLHRQQQQQKVNGMVTSLMEQQQKQHKLLWNYKNDKNDKNDQDISNNTNTTTASTAAEHMNISSSSLPSLASEREGEDHIKLYSHDSCHNESFTSSTTVSSTSITNATSEAACVLMDTTTTTNSLSNSQIHDDNVNVVNKNDNDNINMIDNSNIITTNDIDDTVHSSKTLCTKNTIKSKSNTTTIKPSSFIKRSPSMSCNSIIDHTIESDRIQILRRRSMNHINNNSRHRSRSRHSQHRSQHRSLSRSQHIHNTSKMDYNNSRLLRGDNDDENNLQQQQVDDKVVNKGDYNDGHYIPGESQLHHHHQQQQLQSINIDNTINNTNTIMQNEYQYHQYYLNKKEFLYSIEQLIKKDYFAGEIIEIDNNTSDKEPTTTISSSLSFCIQESNDNNSNNSNKNKINKKNKYGSTIPYFIGYKLQTYSEKECKIVFRHVLESILYLHETCHIIHRNIHFGTLLLSTNHVTHSLQVRLRGFRYATKMKIINSTTNDENDNNEQTANDIYSSYTGYRHNNFAFRAPELDSMINRTMNDDSNNEINDNDIVKQQQYDDIFHNPAIDVWSLGIILYIMLTGVVPYHGTTWSELYDSKIYSHINFNVTTSPSDTVQELIYSMLQIDPKQRITISQILQSDWFNTSTSTNNTSTNNITKNKKYQTSSASLDHNNDSVVKNDNKSHNVDLSLAQYLFRNDWNRSPLTYHKNDQQNNDINNTTQPNNNVNSNKKKIMHQQQQPLLTPPPATIIRKPYEQHKYDINENLRPKTTVAQQQEQISLHIKRSQNDVLEQPEQAIHQNQAEMKREHHQQQRRKSLHQQDQQQRKQEINQQDQQKTEKQSTNYARFTIMRKVKENSFSKNNDMNNIETIRPPEKEEPTSLDRRHLNQHNHPQHYTRNYLKSFFQNKQMISRVEI